MRIVVTGGGSGGHITPLLAVATELKKANAGIEIVYVGQKGDRFGEVVKNHEAIDRTFTIRAGKFRRYHGEGLRQLRDVKTILLNMRDAFWVSVGIAQSIWHIKRLQPQVVFIKGGFVGVPVGLAAALWRVPYVTHDSDALAGLANRIIARWAHTHTVALPAEQYSYPIQKTVTVGVPIIEQYKKVGVSEQAHFKAELDVPEAAPVVLVTGGGLGARTLNNACVAVAPQLLKDYPQLHIFHTTGQTHKTEIEKEYDAVLPPEMRVRMHVFAYTPTLYVLSGAADIVIARAGATNMAELAAQAKPAIIVPNPVLAGGHQLKNAQVYAAKGAAVVIEEKDLRENAAVLAQALSDLLSDAGMRKKFGEALHTFAHPHSAQELAQVLMAVVDENSKTAGA